MTHHASLVSLPFAAVALLAIMAGRVLGSPTSFLRGFALLRMSYRSLIGCCLTVDGVGSGAYIDRSA